jgi:uncharacterized protein (DUF1684 family)
MTPHEQLWDWRRRIADLYGAIRSDPNPRAAHDLWRETRRRMFATHPQSPIDPAGRADYAGPYFYPYDPSLRMTAALTPLADAPLELLDLGEDGIIHLHPFARTAGLADALGGELTLYWIGGYGGGVFLPFRDATSGRETYGAGRYLLDTIKGADLGQLPDGRAILDFNFAYNPSCSYADRYVCPLAPAANTLPRAVRAGERNLSADDRRDGDRAPSSGGGGDTPNAHRSSPAA